MSLNSKTGNQDLAKAVGAHLEAHDTPFKQAAHQKVVSRLMPTDGVTVIQAHRATPDGSRRSSATTAERTDAFTDALVVFEPEALHVMVNAFFGAWDRVRRSGHVCADDRYAAGTRLKLAVNIFALVSSGEMDPIRLRDHAVGSLFPLELQSRGEK